MSNSGRGGFERGQPPEHLACRRERHLPLRFEALGAQSRHPFDPVCYLGDQSGLALSRIPGDKGCGGASGRRASSASPRIVASPVPDDPRQFHRAGYDHGIDRTSAPSRSTSDPGPSRRCGVERLGDEGRTTVSGRSWAITAWKVWPSMQCL